MLEEEDELEVVPELPVYHLPQEWLLLVSNEECLDGLGGWMVRAL